MQLLPSMSGRQLDILTVLVNLDTNMSQKDTILQYLKQAGRTGLNSYDADYKLHIKQAPARVWDLKQDGYTIITKNNPDKSVQWILAGSPVIKKIEKPIEYIFKGSTAYLKEEPRQEQFI